MMDLLLSVKVEIPVLFLILGGLVLYLVSCVLFRLWRVFSGISDFLSGLNRPPYSFRKRRRR